MNDVTKHYDNGISIKGYKEREKAFFIDFSREMLDVKTNETKFQNVGSLNYTSNMSRFFINFFKLDTNIPFTTSMEYSFKGIKSLNGLSGKDLTDAIDNFNNRIELKYGNGRTYKETLVLLAQEYDPDNSWGSVHSALDLLNDIKEIATRYPSAVCSVTCRVVKKIH